MVVKKCHSLGTSPKFIERNCEGQDLPFWEEGIDDSVSKRVYRQFRDSLEIFPAVDKELGRVNAGDQNFELCLQATQSPIVTDSLQILD